MNQARTALRATAHPRRAQPARPAPLALPFAGLAIRAEWLALLLVCLVGLGLRLWDLGRASFWIDEYTSLAVTASTLRDLPSALAVEANMALYYLGLFGWLRLVGFTAPEAVLRLPSALLGAAAVPLVYLLGRRLHSRAAGLAAAGLLAANGYHILLSQQLRSYAAFGILTVLAYLALDRALRRGRRRDWALYALVSSLTFYTHFFAAFTVLAQAVLVLSRRSRAALLGFSASSLAVAAWLMLLVPYFLHQAQFQGMKLAPRKPTLDDALKLVTDLSGGSLGTLALYLGLATIGIALGGAARRRAGYRNWLLLSWLVVPIGLVFGISLARSIYSDRYLFATLAALPLLAGVGLARLPRPVGLLAFGALVVLSLLSRDNWENKWPEQWREAVSYATSRARPADGWIFIAKGGQQGFEYYAGWHWGRNPTAPYAHILEPYDWHQAGTVRNYRGLISLSGLEPFAAAHPRIWLVQSHSYDRIIREDAATEVRDWLTRHGYKESSRRFRYVRLLLYERSSPG